MEQEDYPEDFEQFIVRFATEQDCYDYISKIRWPNGFTCPRCCSSNYWWKTNKRPLMVCVRAVDFKPRSLLELFSKELASPFDFGSTLCGG